MPLRLPCETEAMFLERLVSRVASLLTWAKAIGLADSEAVAKSALAAEGTWERVDSTTFSPVTASGAIFSFVTELEVSEPLVIEFKVIFAAVIEPLASLPCLIAPSLIFGVVTAFFLILSAVTAPGRSWGSPTDLAGRLVAA